MDIPYPAYENVRETCIVQAATQFRLPNELIRAVIRTEGGTTGRISWNKNGSYDMGVMQINSVHLEDFKRYGLTKEMLIRDECLNIQVGAYLLKKNIVLSPDLWQGIGKYHSGTPEKNVAYQKRVWRHVQQLRKTPVQMRLTSKP